MNYLLCSCGGKTSEVALTNALALMEEFSPLGGGGGGGFCPDTVINVQNLSERKESR